MTARLAQVWLRLRIAALATLVALFSTTPPTINGSSGSAAPVPVAESRGALPGADSLLDRPLDGMVTVVNTNDAGAGSLRQAISSAVAGDTVVFAPGVTGTITLTSGALNVDKNLTIQGPGANVLAVSGNNASKVIIIAAGVTVSIAGLTVQNGTGPLGSGIENRGNLTLTAVAVINNGVSGTAGGGIVTNGTQLTMQQVLVANNVGTFGGGLGVLNGVSLTNVTFFGNQGGFGAIFDFSLGAPLTASSLLNVTIAQNTATLGGAGAAISWGSDPITIRNTIVANNGGLNCTGTLTSQGNNLEDANTCGFNQPGDLPSTPAGLDPLGLRDNGGSTQTVRILNTSAAFNGVTAGACPPPTTDQRGIARPQGPRCDIGAVELALPTSDINQDGIVDIRDYGIWRQNFGQTNCGNPADLNTDCIVDIGDYGVWRQNFGHTAGAAARTATPVVAPRTGAATPTPVPSRASTTGERGSVTGVLRPIAQTLGITFPNEIMLQVTEGAQ